MNQQISRSRKAAETVQGNTLDSIKRIALVAMFADDGLMEKLVLKGGNAMALVHLVNSRASIDLDFSMKDDFQEIEDASTKVKNALVKTFDLEGYLAFDVRMSLRPGRMPADLAAFWGGYLVEFKLIGKARAADVAYDIETMRREAINLGQGTKFTIDISRHEYTKDKQEAVVNGYQIYVYSPEMIVCEKLRAICQQMPKYGKIIQRANKANERARDFIDIHALTAMFHINLGTDSARRTIKEMFELKKVPLSFLGEIAETRAFHSEGFDAVKATMNTGITLQTFDYYFDFVMELIRQLEPLWNV